MVSLLSYINANFESKADFARSLKITPQQVNYWLNSGYQVVDGNLVRIIRPLKKNGKK